VQVPEEYQLAELSKSVSEDDRGACGPKHVACEISHHKPKNSTLNNI